MDNQDKSVERRQNKRIRHEEEVRIQLKNPQCFQGALSKDISVKGLKLDVHQFVPLNTEVALSIHIRPYEVIESRGRVVWFEKMRHMDRYTLGIELDSELHGLLENLKV